MFLSFFILCLPFPSPLPHPFYPLINHLWGQKWGIISLQRASLTVISVILKQWCIFKKALPESVFAFKRRRTDSVTRVWVEVHERWIITPHFILICKTMSGHQVVCRAPQTDCRGAVKGFKTCQERIWLWFNLFGRCLTDKSTTKQYFMHNCLLDVLLQSALSKLWFKAEVQKDDAVEEAGGTALRCSRITFHSALGWTSTPSRIPNAIIAGRLTLINISLTLAFVPSPLS